MQNRNCTIITINSTQHILRSETSNTMTKLIIYKLNRPNS